MNQSILIKLCCLVIFTGILAIPGTAQKSKYKLAERYYLEYDYNSAAKIYEDILADNPDDHIALRRSAVCHERLDNLQKSEKRLERLAASKECTSDDLVNYANVLKKRKKYEEAITVYKKYSTLYPEEEWVKDYFEEGNWTDRILRDSSQFVVRNSEINTKWKEFSPSFLGEDLVFSSSRPEGTSKKVATGESYLNLFRASISTEGDLKTPTELGGANSKYHESNGTFDATENMLYFTRNNVNDSKKSKSSTGKLNLAIFYGTYENGVLGKVRPFVHNNPEYSVGQTAFTKDGSRLIFVSDMPGGFGGTDLYYCDRDSSGWGNAVNFGPAINTPSDEMAPYVFSQNVMYFASDGHPGLGGLDVFSIDISSANPKAKNMGYPLNTAYDDFGFVLYEDGRRGFLASNRPGGRGSDDIYEIAIKHPEFVTVTGKIVDSETKLPVSNATVTLKDSDGEEVMQVIGTTDDQGNYACKIEYSPNYTIAGSKNGYFSTDLYLESNPYSAYIDDTEIELMKFDFAAEGKVFDVESGNPIEGATVSLLDELGNIVKSKTTGKDGKYFFGLYVGNQYIVTAVKEKYSKKEYPIDTRNKPTKVIKNDFGLFKLEEGTTVPLENILWDYNSDKVTASSKIELNRVVEILNEYPTMTIELSSHTDSRGSASYNLNLSDRRANSAGDYLVKQGIPRNRIVSKGYGESKLKNKCKDGVNCSDLEHQENRRTEFTILKI